MSDFSFGSSSYSYTSLTPVYGSTSYGGFDSLFNSTGVVTSPGYVSTYNPTSFYNDSLGQSLFTTVNYTGTSGYTNSFTIYNPSVSDPVGSALLSTELAAWNTANIYTDMGQFMADNPADYSGLTIGGTDVTYTGTSLTGNAFDTWDWGTDGGTGFNFDFDWDFDLDTDTGLTTDPNPWDDDTGGPGDSTIVIDQSGEIDDGTTIVLTEDDIHQDIGNINIEVTLGNFLVTPVTNADGSVSSSIPGAATLDRAESLERLGTAHLPVLYEQILRAGNGNQQIAEQGVQDWLRGQNVEVTIVRRENTTAFVVFDRAKGEVNVSFSASDEGRDIVDNANFIPTGNNIGGNVHSGFNNAANRVMDDVKAAVQGYASGTEGTVNVNLSGFSQGGSAAVITAADWMGSGFLENNPNLRLNSVYTFGSPPSGNTAFIDAFQANAALVDVKLVRVVAEGDPIPGMMTENGPWWIPEIYNQIKDTFYLGNDGSIITNPSGDILRNRGGNNWNAHDPINYDDLLNRNGTQVGVDTRDTTLVPVTLQSAFREGVISAAGDNTVIFIDRTLMDATAIRAAAKNEDLEGLKQLLLDETKKQMEATKEGSSALLSDTQLIAAGYSAFFGNEATATTNTAKDGLVVVTMPSMGQYSPGSLLYTFGLTRDDGFKEEHMRPLPGSYTVWARLIGSHEAEHSFHGGEIEGDRITVVRELLERETLSDMRALNDLRARGEDSVVQAFIDIRVMGAAAGDYDHATSIFLDKPGFEGVTDQHVMASMAFAGAMVETVQRQSGVSPAEARTMMTDDPQRFITILREGVSAGVVPETVDISYLAAKPLIAEKMGLTIEQFEELGIAHQGEIAAAWGELRAEGRLTVSVTGNPHVAEFALQYIGAVERMIIPDTSPRLSADQEANLASGASIGTQDNRSLTSAANQYGIDGGIAVAGGPLSGAFADAANLVGPLPDDRAASLGGNQPRTSPGQFGPGGAP